MREFAELDAGVCALTAGATLGGRDALFEVLAAILHLGDVAFEGEDKAVLDAAGQKALPNPNPNPTPTPTPTPNSNPTPNQAYGDALARLLLGEASPSAKLPLTIPAEVPPDP